MTYEYRCAPCAFSFDVIKSVREIDTKEFCTKCGEPAVRAFAPRRTHLVGTAVQEKKWQPALGRAATDSEMRAAAKRSGMIELGNERPEQHLKPQQDAYPTFTGDEIASITRVIKDGGEPPEVK